MGTSSFFDADRRFFYYKIILPQLNPLDYPVWDILQELVYDRRVNRIQTYMNLRKQLDKNGTRSMIEL